MKREVRYSQLISKKYSKLKGKELLNVVNKVEEICNSPSLDFYKNLKHEFKKYKRIHVNNSYIILFFGEDDIVYFVDYVHHDKAYNFDKKSLKKYENIKFD